MESLYVLCLIAIAALVGFLAYTLGWEAGFVAGAKVALSKKISTVWDILELSKGGREED